LRGLLKAGRKYSPLSSDAAKSSNFLHSICDDKDIAAALFTPESDGDKAKESVAAPLRVAPAGKLCLSGCLGFWALSSCVFWAQSLVFAVNWRAAGPQPAAQVGQRFCDNLFSVLWHSLFNKSKNY